MQEENLRLAVEAMARELSAQANRPAGEAPSLEPLAGAWANVLKALALEPEPQTRECPACHRVGRRAATRCGYCWAALSPLDAAPA